MIGRAETLGKAIYCFRFLSRASQAHGRSQHWAEVPLCSHEMLQFVWICFRGTKKQCLISMFWITGERNHFQTWIGSVGMEWRCEEWQLLSQGTRGSHSAWLILLSRTHGLIQRWGLHREPPEFTEPQLWELFFLAVKPQSLGVEIKQKSVKGEQQ